MTVDKINYVGCPYESYGNDCQNEPAYQSDPAFGFVYCLRTFLGGDTAFLDPFFHETVVQADEIDSEYKIDVFADDSGLYSLGDDNYMAYVINYNISINGFDCVLCLLPDYVENLCPYES